MSACLLIWSPCTLMLKRIGEGNEKGTVAQSEKGKKGTQKRESTGSLLKYVRWRNSLASAEAWSVLINIYHHLRAWLAEPCTIMLILTWFCCQVFLALSFGGYPIFSTCSFMLIQGMPITVLCINMQKCKFTICALPHQDPWHYFDKLRQLHIGSNSRSSP